MSDGTSKRPRIEIDSMSSVAEPLVLADAPNHQALWDRLPVGTLFETVRIARAANVDLTAIPSQRLLTLSGPNSHGIKNICEVLGVPAVTVMDEKVADTLDWEAQCIVDGKGAMLECDLQPGQERRSGRVVFAASLSMTQLSGSFAPRHPSKAADSSILIMRIPRMSQSCLFTRVFGSHRFLRISIQDRNRRAFRNQQAADRLFRHSLRPIKILGRTFRPLVEKESTVWYYLEGRDLVGATAEQEGRKVAGEYGLGRLIDDVPKLIDWWIPLEHNGEQLVCKLVTRLHLGISGTWAGSLMSEEIQLHEDISAFYAKISSPLTLFQLEEVIPLPMARGSSRKSRRTNSGKDHQFLTRALHLHIRSVLLLQRVSCRWRLRGVVRGGGWPLRRPCSRPVTEIDPSDQVQWEGYIFSMLHIWSYA